MELEQVVAVAVGDRLRRVRRDVEEVGGPAQLAQVDRRVHLYAQLDGVALEHREVGRQIEVAGLVPGQRLTDRRRAVFEHQQRDVVGRLAELVQRALQPQRAGQRGLHGHIAPAGQDEVIRRLVGVGVEPVHVDSRLDIAIADARVPCHLVVAAVEQRLDAEVDPVAGMHIDGIHAARRLGAVIVRADLRRPQLAAVLLDSHAHAVGRLVLAARRAGVLDQRRAAGDLNLPIVGRHPAAQTVEQRGLIDRLLVQRLVVRDDLGRVDGARPDRHRSIAAVGRKGGYAAAVEMVERYLAAVHQVGQPIAVDIAEIDRAGGERLGMVIDSVRAQVQLRAGREGRGGLLAEGGKAGERHRRSKDGGTIRAGAVEPEGDLAAAALEDLVGQPVAVEVEHRQHGIGAAVVEADLPAA